MQLGGWWKRGLRVLWSNRVVLPELADMLVDGGELLDERAAPHRLDAGIGLDEGAIDVEFVAPNQAGRLALADNLREERLVDRWPEAFAGLGEDRMIGWGFVQIVADKPEVSEVEPHLLSQTPLGRDPIEVAEQGHPKQDNGINRRLAGVTIEAFGQAAHEREVDGRGHATHQVIGWDTFLK